MIKPVRQAKNAVVESINTERPSSCIICRYFFIFYKNRNPQQYIKDYVQNKPTNLENFIIQVMFDNIIYQPKIHKNGSRVKQDSSIIPKYALAGNIYLQGILKHLFEYQKRI